MLETLIAAFETVEDPRCEWKVEHRLLDILVIAVCAVLGEAESFEDIALYGRCKRDWLGQFLALPNGIPSHDTFRRVLMLVDPEAFERCFLGWVRAVFRSEEDAPRHVAIDGKTVRRSFDRKKGRSPLHLVSAYATEGGLVLAQRAAEEKRGELTVLPDLLDGLDLHGCLVSLDALACRPDIAGHIIGQGGDYLLTLKGNRKKAHAEVEAWFATNAFALGAPLRPVFDAFDESHGRLVRRRVCWRSRPSAASPGGARSRPRSGTTSPARRFPRKRWRRPSGTIGGWRTDCIGCSTSSSARTTAGCGSATRPATWRCCARSRSTWRGRTRP
jgi:predicted transposase YbfD/YdcC